ncbi:hypothetical protein BVRB_8g182350 [Beta vulgaris subsp. vulgaris]|nr:hypothetical protein BVRB_8g182350 [Beta vulgaris subsp. vulgaris]
MLHSCCSCYKENLNVQVKQDWLEDDIKQILCVAV